MVDWLIRPYDPLIDEGGITYLWLKSFAHSSFGRDRGAQVDGSDAELAYWREHRKVVMRLLEKADVKILCDPEVPAVIWAFAVTSGDDVVHYAVVKRRFREVADDMFRALLGDRLDKSCVYTHCMQGTGFRAPWTWTLNTYAAGM